MNTIKILQAKLDDLEGFIDHLEVHMKESGQKGIYFSPFPSSYKRNKSEMIDRLGKRWQQPLSAPNWERAWVVKDEDQIVGHLDICGDGIPSSTHRCFLGVGLMKSYRAKGLGGKIMTEAIDWCRKQKQMEWIDLGVFHKNIPAIRLYEKLGFQRMGVTKDRFRIEGNSIDDIQMTLNCRT